MEITKPLAQLLSERDSIEKLRIDLDKQIKEAQSLEIKNQVKIIKDIMKTYGITAKHLGFVEPSQDSKVDATSTPSKGNIDKRTVPAKPKYANPNNPSETWTGRGAKDKRPKWVVELEKAGGNIENCRIKQGNNHA